MAQYSHNQTIPQLELNQHIEQGYEDVEAIQQWMEHIQHRVLSMAGSGA